MLRLCRGSSAVEVVGGSTPSFDQLPDLPQATDDRRGRDLHKQVSQVQFPVNAPREIATINLECIDEQEEQRMDPVPEDEESQAPARPSTGGSSRDGGGAGAERRGFVRVRSIRQPPGLTWSHSRRALEVLLSQEQQQQAAGSDAQNPQASGSGAQRLPCASHEQRLRERLARLNLDMVVVAGDGNCQFRSVSQELYGCEDYHGAVRRAAVERLRACREEFEPFLGEDYDAYMRQMSRNTTWGDELTLRAVCDALGVVLRVITSEPDHWYLTYEPHERKSDREVFLTYIAPIHYNSIRRQAALKAMAFSVGHSLKRAGSLARTASGVLARSLSGGPSSMAPPRHRQKPEEQQPPAEADGIPLLASRSDSNQPPQNTQPLLHTEQLQREQQQLHTEQLQREQQQTPAPAQVQGTPAHAHSGAEPQQPSMLQPDMGGAAQRLMFGQGDSAQGHADTPAVAAVAQAHAHAAHAPMHGRGQASRSAVAAGSGQGRDAAGAIGSLLMPQL